jgi:hypothetical protein
MKSSETERGQEWHKTGFWLTNFGTEQSESDNQKVVESESEPYE